MTSTVLLMLGIILGSGLYMVAFHKGKKQGEDIGFQKGRGQGLADGIRALKCGGEKKDD